MDDKSQAQQTIEVEELKRQLAAAKQGQKNTEHQMERLLQAMLCASSETVVVMDREGIILDANPAAVQRIGGSLEAIRGVCVYDLFDSQTGSRRKAIHHEVCCSRQCLFYEDQREGRTIENHLCPVIDDDGEVSKVVVFAKDITENHRKELALHFIHTNLDICQNVDQIQELLKQSVKEIRKYTECQAVGIRLLDDEGNIPYEAFEGFSQEFYTKESPLSIKHDHCMCIYVIQGQTDPTKPFFTPFGSFYMNGTSAFLATVSEEEKGKTRNACNEYGYETVALVPIRNKERILGLIHLADSRKDMMPKYRLETIETIALQLGTTIQHIQSQNKLEESERRYRMLVENQNDLVVCFDTNLNLLYVSPSYCKIFGKTEQELLFKPFFDRIDKDDAVEVRQSLERLRQHPYTTQHEERALTANGWRWFSWVAKTILNKEGLIESFVSVGRDITDQKQAEKKVRDSERKSHAWLEYSPVCTKVVDLDFNLQFMSQSGIRELKIEDINEFYGKPYPFHFYPDSFKIPMRNNLRKAKETGEIITQEASVNDIEGNKLWYHSTIVPVNDDQGKLDYLLVVSLETTTRKQAEERLQFQAAILDQIQDHVTATDMNGYITYVNHQEKVLFETDSGSLIGKHVSIYGENPKEGVTQQEILDNTKKFGKWRGEVVNYTSEGRSHVMDYRTQILCDEKGQTRGMVGIASDITERKRIEKQLIESEERYRTLVEFSPISVVIMQNRRYVWANPKTLEMLGLKNNDQLINENILRYACPESHALVYSHLRVAEMGEPTGPIEIQLERADNHRIWIEVRSAPIYYKNQPATLIVSNDITSRKVYESQMLEYQNELKKLFNQLIMIEEAERKRIAAELHDQIGQSLVFIKMKHDQLTALLAGIEEKTVADDISIQLRQTIQEIQSLTYDLGSIVLYERGLCKALEEWIYEDFVNRHPIEVCFKHEIQSSLEDHTKVFLFRAVRELLVNIVKHAQARHAAVVIEEKSGVLHLTVEDDGVGYQNSIRMKTDKKGKNFGLLSIRERLDYLRGKMIIDSEQNQGTKITITIPIRSTNQVEDKQQ